MNTETTEQRLKKYLAEIEKNDYKGKKINAFLELNSRALEEAREIDEKIAKGRAGKLAGKVIAVKANINVLGLTASCASHTLEDYKSTYDATVISRIKEQDGLIIGMTNMDEFACGWSGETSAFGATRNPCCLDKVAGGSSSGSAAAVASGFCDIALGSDTGGSIRNPASHCGVVGIKPSYGLVSRYGLIDMTMSFDQIGALARNVDDALLLLNVIKGKDEKDATSLSSEEIKIKPVKNLIIGIPKIKITDDRIWRLVKDKVNKIAKIKGWKIKELEIKHIDLGVQTYYPIVFSEFFSGTRKFDGRRYGKKIEDSCGEEVLKRILGGEIITQAEFEGKYYRKALSAREVIKKDFEQAFKDCDVIIMPTTPCLPWKIGSSPGMEAEYATDALTCLANITGLPAISIPAGKIDNIPVGLQIYGKMFDENLIFSVAKETEKS
ncbi:MAG: amidase family protein [Candidatus Pacearchaeota archaeon]|nr:amidase family protein [Candidatus Pacearchaeota archaeon]